MVQVPENYMVSNDPAYLYRYRSLDGDNLLYAERVLLHNEIYFTSPSYINDPFDCVVKLDFEAPEKDWRKFLLDLFKRREPHLSQEQRKEKVDEIVQAGRHQSEEILKSIINDLQNSVNSVGLLCLSERNNCILMWSHYANGHSGICLEFSHDISEPFFGRAQRINYLPIYEKAHAIYDDPKTQVERVLLSKAKCWTYEAEWRIIDHQNGYGLKYLDPALLTGVVLGQSISMKHEKLILDWISGREMPINVYKAKRSEDGFQIRICNVTSN